MVCQCLRFHGTKCSDKTEKKSSDPEDGYVYVNSADADEISHSALSGTQRINTYHDLTPIFNSSVSSISLLMVAKHNERNTTQFSWSRCHFIMRKLR